MRRGVVVSIGVTIAFATACPTLDAYVCSADADCNAALGGACEDDERCSYPDTTCDSERRYAGRRDLDGPCVSLPNDTTSTTPVDLSSASSEDGASSSITSTGDPACGNGMIEGDEVCDDMNAVDGDGCNVDCGRSGRELYTDSWDFAGGKDYANALTIADDGRFALVGFATREDGDQDVLVQLREPTGAVVWSEIFGDSGLDIGEKIFIDDAGNLVACGSLAVEGVDQGFVRSFTFDQEVVLDVVLAESGGSAIRGCEPRSDGTLVVVGTLGNAETGPGFVALYDDDGSELWRGDVPGTGVQLRDVTSHPDGSIVAAGMHFDPRLAIAVAFTPDGEIAWTPALGLVNGLVDECFGVSRDDTGVYAMGRILNDETSGQDAWVGLYGSFDDPPMWWPAAQNDFSDEFHEVVVHPDGDRVFAGSRTGHDIWVARYDPEYVLRWEDHVAGNAGENDKAWDIAFAPDGTLVAAGYETTIEQGANVWVRRYAP